MTSYASVTVSGDEVSGTEIDGALFEGDVSVHVSMAGEARTNGEGGAEWSCTVCGLDAHEEWRDGRTVYLHDDDAEARSLHADHDDMTGDASDLDDGDVLADVEPVALSWCNSARISADEERDTVTVSISVGDPRGAFTMSVERIRWTCNGRPSCDEHDTPTPHDDLRLSVPDPSDGFLHRPLTPLNSSGYFRIG